MKHIAVALFVLAAAAAGGCGAVAAPEYPNRLIGADGQTFVLEDIEDIVRDPDLSEDQKRDEIRALGIEDEKLIDALLTL
jgi:hypothetical protein